jgi:hypothetical protein
MTMRKWQVWNEEESLTGRAPRFPTRSLLRYRRAFELGWRTGTIENFSVSGVLFCVEGVDNRLDRNTPLELSFAVPQEIGGDGETQVLSRAYTKRFVPPREPNASPALAVRITHYMLPLERRD